MLYFPHRGGLLGRIQEYLRYQSRFGHERIKLILGIVGILITGAGVWWLFSQAPI